MTGKVIRRFQDKYTKEIYSVGDEIEVTEERYGELQQAGNFVEIIENDELHSKEVESKKRRGRNGK